MICDYIILFLLLLNFKGSSGSCFVPSLPASHIPFYLRNHFHALDECASSLNVSREVALSSCWGYEPQCKTSHRFHPTSCPGDSKSWAQNKRQQEETFFNQADFGYIKQLRKEVSCICCSEEETASRLDCSSNLKFCRGRNIMIDFSFLVNISEPMKYKENILEDGQVGGFGCRLNQAKLKSQGGHKSPLQSWFDELEHFAVIPNASQCEVWIEKPTFVTKLDATVNMYHHLCDFVNMYLTMHLNNSLGSLDRSNILIWDLFPYLSNFGASWKGFLKNVDTDLLDLSNLKGKVVCFKDVVFSLLPRMVFGMYYNMPLIPGCEGSGVFQAFRQHMLHRLQVPDKFQYLMEGEKENREIRVTIIVRNTQYRRILNLGQLVRSVQSQNIVVKTVDFHHGMPFKEQLEVTTNTDILIGMHGAGLTHCLFLPDYAVLFELFNCHDEHCYADLSRLRGVEYMTWEDTSLVFPQDKGNHPSLGAHAKFTNYAFDEKEFARLVMKAVKYVRRQRPKYMRDKLKLQFRSIHDEF